MAIPNIVTRLITAMAAGATVACAFGTAPESPRFVLVAVDGHPLPYQVGATAAGQPLIIYSGYVFRNVQNGQCIFAVDLDRGDPLAFTNEYQATEPGECFLRKGEHKTFTYTFAFRNSTADSPHTFRYE